MIRTVLFEDDKVFRQELTLYFKGSEKVELVAAYDHANDAVAHIQKHQPDVVLMDIQMPGISGIEALQKIKAASPTTKVLMQTTFEDNHRIFLAICGGAEGYVLKDINPETIEEAVIDVHNGNRYFSRTIAQKVFQIFLTPMVQSNVYYVALTPRETEVLQWLGKGKSRKMIAAECKIAEYTVNDHIKKVYEKLHVNCAHEAVARALELKLIP